MVKGFRIGWMLTRQSFRILKAHKKLFIFPLCSGLLSLTLITFLIEPLQALFLTLKSDSAHFLPRECLIIATILALLFCLNTIRIFFACTLIDCSLRLFKENTLSLRPSFRNAICALPSILGWVLFHTTIGALIRVFQIYLNKAEFVTRLLSGLVWRFGTYFVLPTLVIKKTGPITAVRQSSALVSKTWGRGLSSNLGLTLGMILAHVAALIPAFLAYHYQRYLLAGVIVTAVLLIFLIALDNTINSILRSALYYYATEGSIAEGFDHNALPHAFRSREKSLNKENSL